jgi:hypothetical protein
MASASQRPVNTLASQQTRGPSLGNSPLNTSHSNEGILGGDVLCSIRSEATPLVHYGQPFRKRHSKNGAVTLMLETCLMQASLVSVHCIARHSNV